MAIIDERGWWLNSQGDYIHPDVIRVNEKIRDELVERLLKKAQTLQEEMIAFREAAQEEIESYFALLLQEYGITEKRGKKGNLTLENFSSTAKVEIRIQETLSFDEKLQIAKLKVDEFLEKETAGASANIQTLITKAFEVDKEGKVDAKKIFALRSYQIDDPLWKEAMELIDESKKVMHTKPYVRFYRRGRGEDSYQNITLDFAALGAKNKPQ